MLICPACGFSVEVTTAPHCSRCDWRAEVIDGVVILMSESDKNDPVIGNYYSNYDRIANDDIDTPILDPQYVTHQVKNLVTYAGDVQGLDVLDLGCGQGTLARALVTGGARGVVAVDISMTYLRRISGAAGITPILANAEDLPFRDAFDTLVSTDVMEHVLNLGSFLISANQSLRMGGKAVIRVPLVENLIAYAAQSGCKYRFVHLRAFNRELLSSTLQGAGFQVVSFHVDGFSVYTPQPFWMRGARRGKLYNRLQSWLRKHLPDPSKVTMWNPAFASLFMRPQEIVVVGRKVASVPVQNSVA